MTTQWVDPTGPCEVWSSLSQVNTGTVAYAAAAQLCGWYIANEASAKRYVKLYDTASVPAASDTPKIRFSIPRGQAANVMGSVAIRFEHGIGIRVTTGQADNDDTAPAAGDVVINLFYDAS